MKTTFEKLNSYRNQHEKVRARGHTRASVRAVSGPRWASAHWSTRCRRPIVGEGPGPSVIPPAKALRPAHHLARSQPLQHREWCPVVEAPSGRGFR